MKLRDIHKQFLTEKKNKHAIKYDMQNINGGYSDGVDIKPGAHAGIMDIAVNIYGGNQSSAHAYKVPPSIQQLQDAFIVARKTGDPVATDIKQELEAYYSNLRRVISLEFVRLLQQLDAQAGETIAAAVQKMNQKYQ